MIAEKEVGNKKVWLSVEEALIICHGLPYEPGSVVDKSYLDVAKFFSSRGFPSVIFDFTGTGKSKGSFSLIKWLEDLEEIAENFEKVSVLGFSMGGAVALNFEKAEKIVAVASPCSAEMFSEEGLERIYANARLKSTLKGLKDFESFKKQFLEEFYSIEPIKSVENLKCPLMLVHGTKDDVVPFYCSEELYRRARGKKKFLIVKNGDHFLRREERVLEKIAEWLKKVDEGVEELTL
ncbi:2-hydroxy-6-oxohepta-2,4-dienoate hydrolase (TodF) [Ferroglobus placidus DSM 10642]|uniref:2-hydroxy-6-oxohepta-2,4-dienoate hydrolase (TodF) n=1 Tax=Ferroglobus placidus (strain DSM 10642 / AEDII12DO) TaxID=589924 RepID=D3RXP9_FERPA|nr:alpha/beta fold hydrolase [Ferroglobus placidus]ADC65262.1 2-hydroxy-6-oxohepta-2,4-dienoate hydrolase (TodF) [Ferroglobus placidus DSM 10642]